MPEETRIKLWQGVLERLALRLLALATYALGYWVFRTSFHVSETWAVGAAVVFAIPMLFPLAQTEKEGT